MPSPISQQASAVDAARRVISGQAPKPSRKEQQFVCDQLDAALITLRWLERHEARIKAAVNREAA